MKIYLVDNNDGTIMGILKKKKKAKALVRLGKERWNEKWKVYCIKVNNVERWVLAGGETYRAKKARVS